jgi:hypothetical protein
MIAGEWTSLRSDLLRVMTELPPEALRVARWLTRTGFARGCSVRSPEPSAPLPIGVAFMPFQWGVDDPWIWLLTTVGMSAINQGAARPSGYRTPERLELCCAFREPETSDWQGFHQAWDDGTLGKLESTPLLIARFHSIALDVASWMLLEKESFTFGDCIKDAALTDRFPSMLLVPPFAELLTSGLAPIRPDGTAAEIDPSDWADTALLQSSGDCVFVQIVPILSDEFEAAETQNGSRFFATGLLPTDDEFAQGLDASAFVTDLQRTSRVPIYLAALSEAG